MALNLTDPEIAIINPVEHGDIPTSADVSGIELRLSNVTILNNDTNRLLFKKKDKPADIYLLVVSINDVANVVQTIDLKGFPEVLDHTVLGVNKAIHFWQKTPSTPDAPSQIHTFISVIKSRQSLRDAGALLANAKNDQDFANIVSTIKKIAQNATPVGQITELVTALAGVIGKFLGNVEDKPLFTWFQSFTNLAGDFDEEGIVPVTQKNEFISVTINKIIRDKAKDAVNVNGILNGVNKF